VSIDRTNANLPPMPSRSAWPPAPSTDPTEAHVVCRRSVSLPFWLSLALCAAALPVMAVFGEEAATWVVAGVGLSTHLLQLCLLSYAGSVDNLRKARAARTVAALCFGSSVFACFSIAGTYGPLAADVQARDLAVHLLRLCTAVAGALWLVNFLRAFQHRQQA